MATTGLPSDASTASWIREWVDDSIDAATGDDTDDEEEYRRLIGAEIDAMYAHRAWEREQQAPDAADTQTISGDF